MADKLIQSIINPTESSDGFDDGKDAVSYRNECNNTLGKRTPVLGWNGGFVFLQYG